MVLPVEEASATDERADVHGRTRAVADGTGSAEDAMAYAELAPDGRIEARGQVIAARVIGRGRPPPPRSR